MMESTGLSNTLHGTAYGVSLRVVAQTHELFARLPEILPHGTKICEEPQPDAMVFTLSQSADGEGYRCLADTELVLEASELSTVLDALRQSLMIHVANHAEKRVFVHAGVVGYRGRALVLPGTSFAGKSTLTAALVRAGAIYYSDEYAVLDEDGYVHPYARDLSMRNPGSSEQRSVAVSAFGGSSGVERLPVVLVAFIRYEQDAAWTPKRVSSGMAALEMLRHAIPVQRTPARVMATLAAMLKEATAWQSLRGEADAAAAALLAWLAEPPSADEGGSAV